MNSDEGGYVHRPGAVDGDSDAAATGSETSPGAGAGGGAVDTRGWVLVAVLVVCLLVVPGIIYVRPAVLSAVGIPYLASLLVLPLLPAAILGLTAVWAMAAAGDDE